MKKDAVLIENALNGLSEAYAELVKRYRLPVYAVALQRLRSAAAAEEITQVVFVTAYQKLEQLKDREKFGAWLRKIAVRQCSMHLRSQAQKERIMHKLEVGDPAIDPATPIICKRQINPIFTSRARRVMVFCEVKRSFSPSQEEPCHKKITLVSRNSSKNASTGKLASPTGRPVG